MEKKIQKSKAIACVLLIVALALLLSIWPLRVWNTIQTETGGGTQNGTTQGVDSTHDAIQDFIAQYDRIDSVKVYVDELTKGRYMQVAFWDVDNWTVMYQDTIDLGQETVPGYVTIPLGLDLTAGGNYRMIFTVQNATYELATEDIPADANAAIGTFYYQDTTVEGSHLLAQYNYAVPLTKTLSLGIMALIVLVTGALLALLHLCRSAGLSKEVTVQQTLKAVLLPVATLLYAAGAVMVFPLRLFDDRADDIVFYEAGLLLTYLAVFYAVKHKRFSKTLELRTAFGSVFSSVKAYAQMVLIALAFVYSTDYMNGLYNIYHTIAERQIMVCILLVIVLTFSQKELINVYNLLLAAAGIAAGGVYYFLHKMAATEKEYDLNNLALLLLLAILVICGILVLNLLRLLIERVSSQKKKAPSEQSGVSLSAYGVLVLVFFLCIIALRNERWWSVVLGLTFTELYLRYAVSKERDNWLSIVAGGLMLNALYSIGYCMLFRSFTGFVMGRYSMMFHTVTVTAEYLTIMLTVSAALLFGRLKRTETGKGISFFLASIYKEALLFGFIAAYMIFTLSRTGFLAVGFAILCMLVLWTIQTAKEKARKALYAVLTMCAAAAVSFVMVFTLQRMIPVMVGHPQFFSIEDASPQTRGAYDWGDYKFMSLERFGSLFSEKILGISGADYNYPDDPYNYDSEGNAIYDADGNALSVTAQKPEEQNLLASSADADAFLAEAGTPVEDAAVSETSQDTEDASAASESVDASEASSADGTAQEGGLAEYSNGRFTIWQAYLAQLNLTGHVGMGVTLADGEVLVHAHNVYIQAAYDFGIPVGILFLLVIVSGILLSGVYYCRNPKNAQALLPFAVMVGFAFAGLTEWNFQLCNPMTIALLLCLPVLIFKEKKN